jgi:hypothetical protein
MTGEASEKPRLTVADTFKAIATMFKAMPQEKLDGIKDVEDLWSGPGHSREHTLPGREELGPFGPAEHMSGSGASKMVREYSDLARQTGMTQLYERMENYMGHMSKSVALLASTVGDVAKGQQSVAELIETFVKAETERTAAEAKKAAAPEFGEDTYTGNALKRFQKARAAFRKSDFADESERELRRSCLDESMSALKAARALLAKAEEAGEDLRGDVTEKALGDIKELSTRVAKAIGDIEKADKEDEDRKEKEAEEAKKAATRKAEDDKKEDEEEDKETKKAGDNCGTDATTEDEKDNTAAKAAKAVQEMEAAAERLNKAAEGNELMQTTLKGFMEVFTNASRMTLPPNFQIVKSEPAVDFERRVELAKDSGELVTMHECTLADSLVTRHQMAAAGNYTKEKLSQDLAAAPENVRNLFTQRAAA